LAEASPFDLSREVFSSASAPLLPTSSGFILAVVDEVESGGGRWM